MDDIVGCLTIKGLVQHLKRFDGDTLVGQVDRYGVLVPLRRGDVSVAKARLRMPGHFGFGDIPDTEDILEIRFPNHEWACDG